MCSRFSTGRRDLRVRSLSRVIVRCVPNVRYMSLVSADVIVCGLPERTGRMAKSGH